MKTDNYGQTILDADDVFKMLYSGQKINELFLDDADIVSQFNKSVQVNADNISKLKLYLPPTEFESKEMFDEANQCSWFMPEDYCPNLVEMLYSLCKTEEQKNRVTEELEMFIQHGMFDLLFYLKYLVDTMREHNIVWGVGRGSSVASYVLYLIGIHKIDSLEYNLDIREFLK